MARSRQRERELARRRYERRRMREQELRARRRRRNTVLGAAAGVLIVIGGLIFLLVDVVAGGSSSKAKAKPTGAQCAPITPNPPATGQPTIPPVVGDRPATLQIKDVKVGTGAVAKKGSSLSVTYIGVSCSTGQVFDASHGRVQVS